MKSCRSNSLRRFERSLRLTIQTSIDWQRIAHSRVEVRIKIRTLGYNKTSTERWRAATLTRSIWWVQKLPKRNLSTFTRSGSSSPSPRSPNFRLPVPACARTRTTFNSNREHYSMSVLTWSQITYNRLTFAHGTKPWHAHTGDVKHRSRVR